MRLSVCLLVMFLNPANMAEPIKILFGGQTWVGPRKHVLDGYQDHQGGMGIFWCCPSNRKALRVTAAVYAAKN